jgi:hypothetical protein
MVKMYEVAITLKIRNSNIRNEYRLWPSMILGIRSCKIYVKRVGHCSTESREFSLVSPHREC